jgi:hypothetical protein
VENERHVSHFPAHGFVFVSKTKKGGLAADRFAPAPGSFFDEKMLVLTYNVGDHAVPFPSRDRQGAVLLQYATKLLKACAW